MGEKKKNKKRSILEMLKDLEKRFGKGCIMRLGDRAVEPVPSIPTGSLGLYLALGTGGLARGRLIEVYGPESSGKTTLALSAIAQAQRQGGLCAFIDAEHALDVQYAGRLGVQPEELLISQPDYGEQALEIVDQLCQSQALALIVVDSVAALVPRAELEGEIGDVHVGLQARLMSQAMRKLAAVSSRNDTTVLFINQLRHKIGVQFGSPETTTGGNALKFYASVRLDIRRIGQVRTDGDDANGTRVRVKVVKNKLAPPFRKAEFEVLFGTGINTGGELVDLGVERKLVERSGSWYSYGEHRMGQGRERAVAFLAENPELGVELRSAILAAEGVLGPDPAPALVAAGGADGDATQQAQEAGR